MRHSDAHRARWRRTQSLEELGDEYRRTPDEQQAAAESVDEGSPYLTATCSRCGHGCHRVAPHCTRCTQDTSTQDLRINPDPRDGDPRQAYKPWLDDHEDSAQDYGTGQHQAANARPLPHTQQWVAFEAKPKPDLPWRQARCLNSGTQVPPAQCNAAPARLGTRCKCAARDCGTLFYDHGHPHKRCPRCDWMRMKFRNPRQR